MTSTEFTGSGTDDRLRAELEAEINQLAAKHTRTAIVVPVKQVLAAVYRVLPDVPRIPNYDPEVAAAQTWSSVMEFSLTELHDDPTEVRARYNEKTGNIRMVVNGEHDQEFELNPDVAEGFFLAGLAAVAYARRQ